MNKPVLIAASKFPSFDSKSCLKSRAEELRLWPMPDPSKPPLHALPHDALGQAQIADQLSRDARSFLLRRLEDRNRPLPRLGEGSGVVG